VLVPGQSEVDETGPSPIIDEDVSGLDVLMDNSPGMEVRDGPGQLGDEPNGLPWAWPMLGGELLQGQPWHVFHDYEQAPFVGIEVNDPDQVGMVALG